METKSEKEENIIVKATQDARKAFCNTVKKNKLNQSLYKLELTVEFLSNSENESRAGNKRLRIE